MAERERETVVVEGEGRSSYGWLIALIVIALIIILFFAFGGMNLFTGGGTETINVDTPETINVETTPNQ